MIWLVFLPVLWAWSAALIRAPIHTLAVSGVFGGILWGLWFLAGLA